MRNSQSMSGAARKLVVLDQDQIEFVSGAGDEPDLPDIIVTGKRMTANEASAWDSWHAQASFVVNVGVIGAVAAGGYFGWAGRAGALAAGANEVMSDQKENAINALTENWYLKDASDGCVDGAYVPGGWSPGGNTRSYCMP